MFLQIQLDIGAQSLPGSQNCTNCFCLAPVRPAANARNRQKSKRQQINALKSDWICQNIPTGTKHSTQRQVRDTEKEVTANKCLKNYCGRMPARKPNFTNAYCLFLLFFKIWSFNRFYFNIVQVSLIDFYLF